MSGSGGIKRSTSASTAAASLGSKKTHGPLPIGVGGEPASGDISLHKAECQVMIFRCDALDRRSPARSKLAGAACGKETMRRAGDTLRRGQDRGEKFLFDSAVTLCFDSAVTH